jgi:Uma2 family endonuclease
MTIFVKTLNMTVSAKRRLFTVEEYHKMAEAGILRPEDRVELINGEILNMSPNSSLHAGCVNRLNTLLNRLFGDQAIVSIQNPLRLDNYSEPEPDVMLLLFSEDFYENRHPLPSDVVLLMEVADSSIDNDREIKLPQYAAAGIAHYWIINLPDRCIEAYSNPIGSGYGKKEIFVAGQAIAVPVFGKDIEVAAIFPSPKK